uniref:Uncharacterized protein n=1 Tax=Mycena chlorophos TaxID=658473 RepID=A0ABQ0M537_MYCCL|nr:predicted protein [Mycena chlorophos]
MTPMGGGSVVPRAKMTCAGQSLLAQCISWRCTITSAHSACGTQSACRTAGEERTATKGDARRKKAVRIVVQVGWKIFDQ